MSRDNRFRSIYSYIHTYTHTFVLIVKSFMIYGISVIQTLFSGQFQSIMTCEDCGHVSARYEPYMQLSVPIPDEAGSMKGTLRVPLNMHLCLRSSYTSSLYKQAQIRIVKTTMMMMRMMMV